MPGVPTGLTATPSNARVVLAWVAPASNGGSAITGYRVYRSTASGSETLLATLAVVTGYTDTAVTNGTTYFYQVTARNAVGEGSRSTEASAKPATVPGVPRNVSAATNATKGVNLSWAAPTSNGGSAVTGYRIYRSTSTGTETFLVAVGLVTSYNDKATTAGVRYFYKITAINASAKAPGPPRRTREPSSSVGIGLVVVAAAVGPRRRMLGDVRVGEEAHERVLPDRAVGRRVRHAAVTPFSSPMSIPARSRDAGSSGRG